MKLKSISISLTPDYLKDAYGEYTATAEVEGGYSGASIKVSVAPEQTAPIVALLAQCVAESMAKSADQFRSEVLASIAGPAIDMTAIGESGVQAEA